MRKPLSKLKEEKIEQLKYRPGGLYIGTTLCEVYQVGKDEPLIVKGLDLDSDPRYVEAFIWHSKDSFWKYEFDEIEIEPIF